MNTDMVHVIPDADLANAVHSPTGAIPSWLALAELNRRNTLRQSAPVQAPQGTVADGVVGQALKASGIQAPQGGQGIMPASQSPQAQTQPQAPANGGIMSSVPRMAQGGIMKLAGGGPAPLINDQQGDPSAPASSTYGGFVPMLTPLNPADYKTDYIAPNLTTDQQANDATNQRYGPGVDYKPNLDEIAKMQEGVKPWTGKDWLKNMGASLMASKDRNVGNAFGSALLGTNALEKSTNQQNLLNSEKLLDMKTGIQENQQSRQDKIADAAERYQTAKNALAESQSVQQNSNARSNNEMAATLAERNQTAQVEMDKAKRDFMTNVGNPIFAANVLNDAKRRGDASTAGIAQDALDSDWTQKQKESDMDQARLEAIRKATVQSEYGLAAYRSKLERGNKEAEMGMQFKMLGLNPDGSPLTPTSGSGGNGGSAVPASAPSPGQSNGISSAPGNEYDKPADRLDVAALNMLKTGQSGVPSRGNAATAFNLATQGRMVSKILPQYGLTSDDVAGIQEAYKGAHAEYQKVSSTMAPVLSAENTIDNQLPNLVALGKQLQVSGLNINSPIDALKRALGEDGYQKLTTAITTIPHEYSVVMDRGSPNVQTVQHMSKILNDGLSAGNIEQAADQMKFEMEQRKQGYTDELANAKYHMSIPSLSSFVKHSVWGDDPGVVERRGLPTGNGDKLTDPAVARKFLESAARKIGVSDLKDPRVHKEAEALARVKGFGF